MDIRARIWYNYADINFKRRRTMKRTLSILLAVMMLLSVAACNNTPASPKLTRGTWTGD